MPPKRAPSGQGSASNPAPRSSKAGTNKKKFKAKREIGATEVVAEEPLTSLTLLVQGSNLVTFGAGLQVTRVIPGSELSSLFIRDLPSNATDDEITDTILVPSGVDPTGFKIASWKREGKVKVAQVLLRTEEAKTLVARHTRVGVEGAEQNNTFRPTADPPIKLKFELQPFHRSIGAMTVPHFADSLSLAVLWYARSPPTETPRGTPAAFDSTGLIQQLKETMERDGCIEGSFKATPMTSTDGMKVTALFKSRHALEVAAKRVSRRAPQQRGPTVPRLRVIVPTEFYFSICLPVARYEAQEALWAAEAKKAAPGQDGDLMIRIDDKNLEDRDRVFVNLQGSDEVKVGALKVRLERLSAGERLGAEMWHDALMDQDILAALSEKVETKTGVVMTVDPRVNILRLFGTGENLQVAKIIIRRTVNMLRKEKESSVDQSGKGAGASEENNNGTSGGDGSSCFSCLDRTPDPVVLDCHHSFCAKCFGQALESPTLLHGTFPILCSATQGSVPFGTLPCASNAPIPLHIIREVLPTPRYNRLVDAAFAHYVQSNRHLFKSCPTPFCTEIYRCSEQGAQTHEVRQCPSCFAKSGMEGHVKESCQPPATRPSGRGDAEEVEVKDAAVGKKDKQKVRGRSNKFGQREHEDFALYRVS